MSNILAFLLTIIVFPIAFVTAILMGVFFLVVLVLLGIVLFMIGTFTYIQEEWLGG